jgi:hypothetical protein
MVITALSMKPVSRLKQTFQVTLHQFTVKLLNEESRNKLEDLKHLVDGENDFMLIRNMYKTASPPVIPYPGVYHKDLLSLKKLGEIVIIENDEKWINADRVNRTTTVVKAVLKDQNIECKISPMDQFYDYIVGHPNIPANDMDGISLNLEPE